MTLLALVLLLAQPPQRVLFVGAHPDDEMFAAPLLYELCVTGTASCRWLVLTRGEKGGRPAIRAQELLRSAAALHATVLQWPLPDGNAHDWGNPIARMQQELAQADLVITFDAAHGTTMHPDHRAAGALVLEAARAMKHPPRVYAIQNRATMTRNGTVIVFEAAPPPTADALISRIDSWAATLRVAREHRSQFGAEALAALDRPRVIVAAAVR